MALTLTNLPRIMRHHGWNNGARLMEIWFSRPPAIAASYGPPDASTIRMDSWILTFPRARQVYEQLIRERIWANPAARRQIASMIARQGLLRARGTSFDPLSRPAPELDALAVNFRAVSFGLADLDDMSAALGNFVFKVAIAGEVAQTSTGQTQVTVREVGVFIRDSYDFNGSQELGFWDETDNSVSMFNPFSGTRVTNDSFRAWRTANRRGGDFLVFSDVKRTRLATPDVFTVP